MKSLTLLYTTLTLVLLSISACNKENPLTQDPPATLELLPLKIGNTWSLKSTALNPNGTILSVDTLEITVLRDTTIQGQQWFITSFGIYRNATNGLFQWLPGATLVHKYPGNPSDTYVVTSNTITIASIDTLITTPAGNLHCYRYLINDQNTGFQMVSYYSPGVGWVYFESAAAPGGNWYLTGRYELISYQLQ